MTATSHRPNRRRTPAQVLQQYRRRIVDGVYAPGERFPTQARLRQATGFAAATVQRLYHELTRDGFIVTRGAAGTIVSPTPPHLCRYGVVFPTHPLTEAPAGTFVSVLAAQCARLRRQGARDLPLYFGLDRHTDVPDYPRVVRDLRAHRLAGLILVTNPKHLAGTPLVEAPDIPRVAIGSGPLPGIPAVTTDMLTWQDQALDYLARRGRRRVAVVDTALDSAWFERLGARLAARRMRTRPHWRLQGHPAFASGVRNPAHLLMEGPERPDAVLITDDVFAEHALKGILDAGLRVPDDVDIVAHCNFPLLKPSALPIQRLGFPVDEVLAAAFRAIDLQRQGLRAPRLTAVRAVFEDAPTSAQATGSRQTRRTR